MKKIGIMLALLMVTISAGCFTNISPEESAIRQNKVVGSISEHGMNPGFVRDLWFLDKVYKYDLAMRQFNFEGDQTIIGVTKDGLNVGLDVTVQYRYTKDNMNYYVMNYGKQERVDSLIYQRSRNAVYETLRKHEASDLYGGNSQEIEAEINNALRPALADLHITLEKAMLKRVTLPEKLKNAIDLKLKADQENQQMEFEIEIEKKKAEQRVIEAGGIAESQAIIDTSLTDEYLRWYWIKEGLKEGDVYYVPIQEDGLPLFKSVDKEVSEP